MYRRQFLKKLLWSGAMLGTATTGSCLAWNHFFDGPLLNPCDPTPFPNELRLHPLMLKALDGLDGDQLWDCHFHLLGNGTQPSIDGQVSGVWLNSAMRSWLYPKRRVQYAFYLDSACIQDPQSADREYMQQISRWLQTVPSGARFMLLAFDYFHDLDGNASPPQSTFYIPNAYAARMAASHPQFEWIASVHPYREDALETLRWCKANGARAVKWLPPAMNIDPGSPRCDAFYQELIRLQLPLLSHAGEEQAVEGDELQRLANPLLLRRPLEQGVKVIVAHCASLGQSPDIERAGRPLTDNFALFTRLMEENRYRQHLLADISAIELFNREPTQIRQLLLNRHWHSRLLFATDFPLPGVMPLISAKNLADHQLLDVKAAEFVSEVRRYNPWLFDLLLKRLMRADGQGFDELTFATRRHFTDDNIQTETNPIALN